LIEERARSAIEDDLRAPCFSEPIVGERFWSGFGGFDGVCRLGVWKILLASRLVVAPTAAVYMACSSYV
jgi:hypothetical protein